MTLSARIARHFAYLEAGPTTLAIQLDEPDLAPRDEAEVAARVELVEEIVRRWNAAEAP
jgi:hypothetical protein